ncbi:DUF4192 domain-containing protein [Cellulomonas fimi]|uniref:DUF4192 domain-containing protein n=1 Tax=Cellulomonas fimi TaxID=1708 RepID=A0A7Y0QGR0_CELFI|nr:DUF4192 domain-containing protein [Cellulomonas fimi]NMR19368.1 DUF4192 domain-containing protein [Cellulomonas fimi]
MDTTTIRVREPRELLALLPYQLGFQPRESAVAVSLRPPRGRVGLVARVDLPDLADRSQGPQLARGLVSHLVSDGARRGVLVLYTDIPADRRAVARGASTTAALTRAAADHMRDAAEPFLEEMSVWVVGPTGYLSLDCDDPSCCPEGGRPLSDLQSSEVGAHMVLAGALVADSREDLARVAPAPSAARRNAARAADRWAARGAAAVLVGPEAALRWQQDGLALWRAATERRHAGHAPLPPAEAGRLEAALADVRVRDAVLLALVQGTGDLAERALAEPTAVRDVVTGTSDALGAIVDPRRGIRPDESLVASGSGVLEEVVAHARSERGAPALTLLALLAWWQGDGPRAGVLLDQAFSADASYRLAHLLGDALASGLAPGWVRRSR